MTVVEALLISLLEGGGLVCPELCHLRLHSFHLSALLSRLCFGIFGSFGRIFDRFLGLSQLCISRLMGRLSIGLGLSQLRLNFFLGGLDSIHFSPGSLMISKKR